ncbi:class I SAM-dependent methyltransferase [Spirosoma utsteinense]|uniref:SAM-dependent methyltransferase n=1 Tax=Spirosoma utsteinense TaxID=2585773 RepID=A0ABR6WA58_9BACT|nr:class I SAM-dependent methyltransferase [Spirosoma utsteinense]MBC3784151.1 SAM-dependent methyltransferase [Spirosoma utsteinense]MBC3792760.1 SAM-dependent methyltransferase [Spirosoma utsteinense]
MVPPIDRFSGHAGLYAQFRIDYPKELYDFILQKVPDRTVAWDCATGNGQVAGALADWFEQVDATDISETQLLLAVKKPNINYQLSPAEQTPFANHTFDLITVAQALHWFDVNAFHQEVRRVAKPNAVIAEWGYGLAQISDDIDSILIDFYRNRVGPYWDPQRKHIDAAYATLPFPFANVEQPTFDVRRMWTLDRFLNYLRTWSAVRQYIHENEEDPVGALGEELIKSWGDGEREIAFPVFTRIGIVC